MTTQDQTASVEHQTVPVADDAPVGDGTVEGPTNEERDRRLEEGAEELTTANRSILAHPRFLLALSATLMTIGVTAILLGWAGAARSTFTEEQIPYLISGGLLGVALSIIGALTLFTHWLTLVVRESRSHEAARRADHEALMESLGELTNVLIRQENGHGSAGSGGHQRPLRAAPRR